MTFKYYLDKALDLGKKSYFTSKAQQKDALEEAEVKLESDYIELQQNEQKIVKELKP